MNMNATPQSSDLTESLRRFEAVLLDAPPEHEIRDWSQRLKDAFDPLARHVDERRRQIHEKLFREIAHKDPSRLEQIQRLKEIDADIQELLEVVKTHVIVQGLPKSDAEQQNVEQQILDLTARGTELVSWIKDQEETVATWFAEAFARAS